MIIYQNHKHVVKIIFFLKIECGISIKVLHNSGHLDGKYRSTLVLHIRLCIIHSQMTELEKFSPFLNVMRSAKT